MDEKKFSSKMNPLLLNTPNPSYAHIVVVLQISLTHWGQVRGQNFMPKSYTKPNVCK
jgi:hypothetical protein